jgi:hypothetical protein
VIKRRTEPISVPFFYSNSCHGQVFLLTNINDFN